MEMRDKIALILAGVIIILLIYVAARVEQVWNHIRKQQDIKDIKDALLEDLKKQ
jgi:uncharacterized membrane protein YidH (DUF202 family)